MAAFSWGARRTKKNGPPENRGPRTEGHTSGHFQGTAKLQNYEKTGASGGIRTHVVQLAHTPPDLESGAFSHSTTEAKLGTENGAAVGAGAEPSLAWHGLEPRLLAPARGPNAPPGIEPVPHSWFSPNSPAPAMARVPRNAAHQPAHPPLQQHLRGMTAKRWLSHAIFKAEPAGVEPATFRFSAGCFARFELRRLIPAGRRSYTLRRSRAPDAWCAPQASGQLSLQFCLEDGINPPAPLALLQAAASSVDEKHYIPHFRFRQ